MDTFVMVLLPLIVALADAAAGDVGRTFQLTIKQQIATRDDRGGSSSSTDNDTLIERIIAQRNDGQELEYALPPELAGKACAQDWQFPARVLRHPDGLVDLLNADEMTRRRKACFAQAKWPDSICGHWVFTWTAIKLECEPQSVLGVIAAFAPWPDRWEAGRIYAAPEATRPVTLVAGTTDVAPTLVGDLQIDPDKVRKSSAESDRVVAEVMRKPVPPLKDAVAAHAADRISGTIHIVFYRNTSSSLQRMTWTSQTVIQRDDQPTETSTTTRIVERRPLPR